MKKLTLCLLALIVALAPATLFANSLTVDGAAALEGSFGLNVSHDNSSAAYVQDNTPAGETVYRLEFLFEPNAFNTNGNNVRQAIARTISVNPSPGQFVCPGGPFVTGADIFIYWIFGGTTPYVTAFLNGRGCGPAGVGNLIRIDSSGADANANGTVRVCWEWEEGSTGTARLAVTDETTSCAAASYQSIVRDTAGMTVEQLRVGTPQTNGFGAGETATLFFDSVASYRTLGM